MLKDTLGQERIEAAQSLFVPLSWAIDAGKLLDVRTADVIALERNVPIEVTKDLSLRAKIIDACGLACVFCHNEGTPVAVDNTEVAVTVRGIVGRSGRVSVFSATNGVDFIPGKMDPFDPNFIRSLGILNTTMGLNELHLTGGEPTLHPQLPDIVRAARGSGYSVSMTSNGEKGAQKIEECAEAGLDKINFSIFGTTPQELAEVQNDKFQDTTLAQKKIDALHESIATAADCGIKVSANLVMSDESHERRVARLIDEFDPRLDLRILPDLSKAQESALAIYGMLAKLGATPILAQIEAGSSNARVRYVLPNGRTIAFKQIRPTRLEECADCQFNNPTDCMEGFYGTRLYIDRAGKYIVGVCLQRMDLVSGVDDFVGSDLQRQVVGLRQTEYDNMQHIYSKVRP